MQIKASCISSAAKEYALRHAILIYQEKQSQQAIFASVHDVRHDKKGVFQIEAGVPVSKSGLVEMMRTLTPDDFVQPELLGDHILAKGNNHLVWWCKPQKRHVWFKCENIGEGEISGSTDLPGLVFIVSRGEWFVFALKGRSRPRASTRLYPAPFLNVWAGGRICVGNIDIPSGAMKFNTDAWEESFFRSYFTHTNQHEDGAQTKFEGGIYALWKALLNGEKFSIAWLPKSSETLGQAFERTVLHERY